MQYRITISRKLFTISLVKKKNIYFKNVSPALHNIEKKFKAKKKTFERKISIFYFTIK